MKLAALKKRVGFLPIWAWLTLAGVGLYAWRKRTSSTTTPANDVGAAVGSGANGYSDTSGGGFGAGDAGGGLPLDTPTQQGTADPNLTGPGAAAVYDPVGSSPNQTGTGNGATLSGSGSDIGTSDQLGGPAEWTPLAPVSRARTHTVAARDASLDFPHVGPHVDPTVAGTGSKKAVPPKYSHGTRRKTPRARPAPALVSEHGRGQMHPVSKASKPRVASSAKVARPVAIARSRRTGRGAATTKPNAGARSAAPRPKPTPPPTQVRRPGAQL